MILDNKRRFMCPATGLITDIKHCKSYGLGEGCDKLVEYPEGKGYECTFKG